MNKKLSRLVVLLIVSILLGLGLFLSRNTKPEIALTKVSMLDVGQGDSFLIQTTNGKQMLIDGGKDATVLGELSKVMPLNDRSIDIVLATHPDMDHIGGLDEVLKRYKVRVFVTSEVGGETAEYKSLMKLVQSKKIPAYFLRSGMKINFSDTEYFEVLFPDRDV